MRDFLKQSKIQTELFEETPSVYTNDINENESTKLHVIEFLKDIKVELSSDIVIIMFLVFILFSITMYLLGIQKGKKIEKNNVRDTASYIKEIVTPQPLPVVVSKQELPKFKTIAQQTSSAVTTNKLMKHQPKVSIDKPVSNVHSLNKMSSLSAYKYTIQVLASRDKQATEKQILKLKKQGFKAFLAEQKGRNGKKWYYLCVGKYRKTKEASQTFLKVKKYYKECFLNALSNYRKI